MKKSESMNLHPGVHQ